MSLRRLSVSLSACARPLRNRGVSGRGNRPWARPLPKFPLQPAQSMTPRGTVPGCEFVDVRRAGVVQGRHPRETGGEGRCGHTLVERLFEDVADDLVAVRVVDPDRQLNRDLGTGLDAVEGGFSRTQPQGPGMQIAVVLDDHEGGAAGIGSQAPGGGVGDRPRNVDFVLCLGIAGQGQVGNPAAAQAGGDGAVPAVVIKQVARRRGRRRRRGSGPATPASKRCVLYTNPFCRQPSNNRAKHEGGSISLLQQRQHKTETPGCAARFHVGCTFRADFGTGGRACCQPFRGPSGATVPGTLVRDRVGLGR